MNTQDRNEEKAVGPCLHCGKATEGQHIAGTVYDYQCDACCAEIDAGFEAFIAAAVAYATDTP
jgi:hypothetical protein